jgi:hypothetical protein
VSDVDPKASGRTVDPTNPSGSEGLDSNSTEGQFTTKMRYRVTNPPRNH